MTTAEIDRRAIPRDMRLLDWRAPDGWLYRRADWPQPEGAPARGSLLFAGGRGDFIEKYLEPMAEWRQRGWNVASFDWRGQGRSRGGIDANHARFDMMVADLEALVADWKQQTPGPHVVVGHSMGGHLVLRGLVERKVRVDAAVLIAPMVLVNSGPLPAWFGSLVAGGVTHLGFGHRPLWTIPLDAAPVGSQRQKALTESPVRYQDEQYWWSIEPSFRPTAPTFGWIRAAYRSAKDFTPVALAGVDLPVLIIATDQDRLVSPAAIRRVAHLLPQGELAWFNDAAHEILREDDPIRGRAMRRIDAFFDKHLKSA